MSRLQNVSEDSETDLPPKGQRKRKIRKLSTSSENESEEEFISAGKENSKPKKRDTLLQDKDDIIPNSESKTGLSKRVRWTPEQELALRNKFSEHLEKMIYPSTSQINIRKKDSPFASRSAAQIKSKLQFMLKKTSRPSEHFE